MNLVAFSEKSPIKATIKTTIKAQSFRSQFGKAPFAGGLQDFLAARRERLNDWPQIDAFGIGGRDHRVALHTRELGSPKGCFAVTFSKRGFVHG